MNIPPDIGREFWTRIFVRPIPRNMSPQHEERRRIATVTAVEKRYGGQNHIVSARRKKKRSAHPVRGRSLAEHESRVDRARGMCATKKAEGCKMMTPHPGHSRERHYPYASRAIKRREKEGNYSISKRKSLRERLSCRRSGP